MALETKLDERPPWDGESTDPIPERGNVAVPPAGRWGRARQLLYKAVTFGRVEVRGITPIPVKERTVDKTVNVFTLWWSMNTNILG
jgi:hypothetical protein